MAFFTQTWVKATVDYNLELAQLGTVEPWMNHTAGDELTRLALRTGDTIFVVNYYDHRLRVIAPLVVDFVTDQEGAEQAVGGGLWPASLHVIAKPNPTATLLADAWLSDSELRSLQFVLTSGAISTVKLNRRGYVEPQSFRGAREITRTSARTLLNAYSRHCPGFKE